MQNYTFIYKDVNTMKPHKPSDESAWLISDKGTYMQEDQINLKNQCMKNQYAEPTREQTNLLNMR